VVNSAPGKPILIDQSAGGRGDKKTLSEIALFHSIHVAKNVASSADETATAPLKGRLHWRVLCARFRARNSVDWQTDTLLYAKLHRVINVAQSRARKRDQKMRVETAFKVRFSRLVVVVPSLYNVLCYSCDVVFNCA
jgi:hypothetical protein